MSYNVTLPNGVVISDIPDDIPQQDVRAKILQQFPELAAQEKRSIGTVGTDLLAGLGVGAGSLLQLPGQVGQLAGIFSPEEADTGLQGAGKRLEEFSQEAKSPTLRGKEAVRAQEVAGAEGELSKFTTFIKQTLTDPTLLASFFTEQVPNLVGSMGGGLLARGGVKLLMRETTEQTLGKVGVAGAVGTGAVMQGADVGSDTYERVFKELEEQGVPSEEANERALGAGRQAAIQAAALTVGTSYLIPGGTTIERALVGKGLPGTGGFVRGATREALQEGLEETGGRFASNVAVLGEIPGTSLTEGLGEAAASGVLAGGLFGGPAGAITGRRDARAQQQLELARNTSEKGRELADAAEAAELDARRAAYEAEQAELQRRIAAERFKDSTAYAELEERVEKIKARAQAAQKKVDDAYAELSAFTGAAPDLFGDILPEQPAPEAVAAEPTPEGAPIPVQEGQLGLPLPPIMEDTGQLGIPEVGLARQQPTEIEPSPATISPTGQLELPGIGTGQLPAQVTESDFASMGIGRTNKKLREQILGKDLGIPEQAEQVRQALEEYASSPNRSGRIAESVERFLQRPEFAAQLPLELEQIPLVADVTPAGEPTPVVTEASLDGLLLPKRAAARSRLLGKDLSNQEDRAAVAAELKKLSNNSQLNPEARQRVQEVLAGSPFIRTQGELFTPEETPIGGTDVEPTITGTAPVEPTARRRADKRDMGMAGMGDRATAAPTGGAPTVPEAELGGLAPSDAGTTTGTGRGPSVSDAVTEVETLNPDTVVLLETLLSEPVVDTSKDASIEPASGKPKPSKPTPAERYMAEYESEYAQNLARDKYNTESSSVSPVTRLPMTARDKILETIAADIYAGEGKGRRARTVYKALSAEDKAAVDTAIAKYKEVERKGAIEIQRLDALREREAELRQEFGPDVASAIVGKLYGNKTPELIAAVYAGNTVAALQAIAKGKGFSQLDQAIARRLLENKTYPLPKIEVVPRSAMREEGADGQYIPFSDTIQIVDGMVDSHTVLHEAVHGFLHAAIYDFENGNLDNKPLQDLRALFDHVKEVAPELAQLESTRYAMSSLTEFASEAMSNPELQARLARIPYKDSNVFTKFAKFIMDLLGITPGANNALAAALMYGERSFNFGRSYQQFTATGERGQLAPPPAKVVRAKLEDISKRAGGIPDAPPPKRMFQDLRQAATKESMGNFLNRFETSIFSSDAGLQNRVRSAFKSDPDWKNVRETLLSISTGQALHSDGVASRFLEKGNAKYDPELHTYVVADDANNFVSLVNELNKIAKEEGISYDLLKQYANQAFIAERISGMSKTEKDFYSTLTTEQVKAGLEFFQAIPGLRKVQSIWNGIRKNTMDMAVDSGLYTKEEAKELLNVMDYVPFFREDQVEAGAGPQAYGRGLLNFAKGRKIKGSDQKINDIFDNMERWVNYTVSRSVKNKTANNMLDVATRVFPEEVKELRTDEQLRMEDRQNVIDIYVGGNRKRIKFADPLFVDAFGGTVTASTPLLGGFGAGAVKMANFLRQSVVLVPLFSISQLSQDSISAMFTSGLKSPLSLPLEIVSEFGKTLTGKSAAHERLSDMAAAGIRDYSATVAKYDRDLRSGLPAPSIGKRAFGALEKFAMASDNAVRQGIYNRTLLETGGIRMPDGTIRGGDEATAVQRAFEVINFKRSGTNGLVQVLRQVVPFFGAYLQAVNVMYKVTTGRGISPSQRRDALITLANTTAKVMALAFLYTSLVADDEEYREMDPALRDRSLLIPGTSFKLPMRPDVFMFAKLAGEYGYQIMTDDGFTDGVKMRRGLRDALANTLTGPTAVPQAIKPIFEVGINYDFFSGRPIVGRGLERLPVEQQYSANSTELAKILGRTGLISPVNADHLMRGYFGTMGGMFNMFISSAVRSSEGRTLPDVSLPDTLARIPGVGVFVTREFGSGARNDFYELRREVDTAVAGFNRLKKFGTPEEAREFLSENQNLLQLRTQVNRVQTQLSKIREQRTRVLEAPDSQIGPAEKGEIIKRLSERERAVLQNIYELRRRAGF